MADVAGALTKTAQTTGKDGVAAARAVLAVEAGGAWGERSGKGEAEADEASAVDEVAIERLSAAQRRRVAAREPGDRGAPLRRARGSSS